MNNKPIPWKDIYNEVMAEPESGVYFSSLGTVVIARTNEELRVNLADAIEAVPFGSASLTVWLFPTEQISIIDVAGPDWWLPAWRYNPLSDDKNDTHYTTTDGVTVPHPVDAVIVGGEDTPLHPQWVRDIRNQCKGHDTPFYFLGWGDWLPEDHWGFIEDMESLESRGVKTLDDILTIRLGKEVTKGVGLYGRLYDIPDVS